MAQVLELAQLLKDHGVAEVDVGRRGIDAELHPQRPALGELALEGAGGQGRRRRCVLSHRAVAAFGAARPAHLAAAGSGGSSSGPSEAEEEVTGANARVAPPPDRRILRHAVDHSGMQPPGRSRSAAAHPDIDPRRRVEERDDGGWSLRRARRLAAAAGHVRLASGAHPPRARPHSRAVPGLRHDDGRRRRGVGPRQRRPQFPRGAQLGALRRRGAADSPVSPATRIASSSARRTSRRTCSTLVNGDRGPALLRARWRRLTAGSPVRLSSTTSARERRVQGGSTITQQFVKNALRGARRPADGSCRRLREAARAYHLERDSGRSRRILTQYLNTVYFGERGLRRGVGGPHLQRDAQAASRTRSRGRVADEAAAGRPSSPRRAAYDPVQNPLAAKRRRDLVLRRMLDQRMHSPGRVTTRPCLQAIPSEDDIDPPRPDSGGALLLHLGDPAARRPLPGRARLPGRLGHPHDARQPAPVPCAAGHLEPPGRPRRSDGGARGDREPHGQGQGDGGRQQLRRAALQLGHERSPFSPGRPSSPSSSSRRCRTVSPGTDVHLQEEGVRREGRLLRGEQLRGPVFGRHHARPGHGPVRATRSMPSSGSSWARASSPAWRDGWV